MFEKNNKAKIEKFMQKNGLTLDDMISLYKEDENNEPQPKAEPQPQPNPVPTPQVEEPKKSENGVEPKNVEVDKGKLEVDYKQLFDALQKENASLKESINNQNTKLDKVYEFLSAQGKTPEGNEFPNKVGGEVKTGMNNQTEESDFAKLLGGK